jgi:hypothetical protein
MNDSAVEAESYRKSCVANPAAKDTAWRNEIQSALRSTQHVSEREIWRAFQDDKVTGVLKPTDLSMLRLAPSRGWQIAAGGVALLPQGDTSTALGTSTR